MLEKLRIKERLTKSFRTVAIIASAGALVGILATIVVAMRYSYALTNYGFSQGDIGKAMVVFADARSATRAVIGYQDEAAATEALAIHDQKKEAFTGYWATVEDTLTTTEERELYQNLSAELEKYWQIDAEVIELGNTTDAEKSAAAQAIAVEQLDPIYESTYVELAELLNTNVAEGNALAKNLTILMFLMIVLIIAVIAAAMVISNKLGAKVAEGIAAPLGKLGNRLKTFAEGDLSSPFPTVEAEDEVADMIREANAMADRLNAIINDAGEILGTMAGGDYTVKSSVADMYTGDFEKLITAMRTLKAQMTDTLRSIEESSSQVSAGSGNLAEASQNLAEGATEQAGAVEELQATITDITEGIEKGAKTAEDSYTQAQKYADEADHSRVEMQSMVSAMERINETSTKIENIISEIEDIASQTNLLSLNASIEAARAGEAGRGFAVVADQIRQLADQTTQSAVDTRELIEGSLQEIAEGNKAAERAADSIEAVVNGIKQIAESAKELSDVSSNQALAMRQAELGVNQISEVVQANSATAQESSATSEELSAQAEALDELISRFQLEA